jgi:hypothetical protein
MPKSPDVSDRLWFRGAIRIRIDKRFEHPERKVYNSVRVLRMTVAQDLNLMPRQTNRAERPLD